MFRSQSHHSLHPIDIDYGENNTKDSFESSPRLDDTNTPLLSPLSRERNGS